MEKKEINEQNILPFSFRTFAPDGKKYSIPLIAGESREDLLVRFKDNWFKLSKEHPEECGHMISDIKCPHCGGEVHYIIKENGEFLNWCVECQSFFGHNF